MYKKIGIGIGITLILGTICLTGCAHTGLVTGPAVTGPSVDRKWFIEQQPTTVSFENKPTRSDNPLGEMEMPNNLKQELSNVEQGFKQASKDVASQVDNFQNTINSLSETEQKTFEVPKFEEMETKELETQTLSNDENQKDEEKQEEKES